MSSLQRINADLKLDIVMWQLSLLASIAGLLLEPLLATSRKRGDRVRDRRRERANLVHGGACVDIDWR